MSSPAKGIEPPWQKPGEPLIVWEEGNHLSDPPLTQSKKHSPLTLQSLLGVWPHKGRNSSPHNGQKGPGGKALLPLMSPNSFRGEKPNQGED